MRTTGVRINILAIEPGLEGAFATCRMRVAREFMDSKPTITQFFKSYDQRVKAWHIHQRNSNVNRQFRVAGGLQERLQSEIRSKKINVLVVPNGELPEWLEQFVDWFAVYSLDESPYRQRLLSSYARRTLTPEVLDLRDNYIMRVGMCRSNADLLTYYNGDLCRRAYRRIYQAISEMGVTRHPLMLEYWKDEAYRTQDYIDWCKENIPSYDRRYCKMTKRIKEHMVNGGAFNKGFGALTPKGVDALAREVWELFVEDSDDRMLSPGPQRTHGNYKSRRKQ